MDGFADFTFGSGDDQVGKKSKRFKAETNRTYRVSFIWFTEYTKEGLPAENAQIRFTGCENIYKDKIGPVLIDASNRAAMVALLGEQPKQKVATIIVVWPCDKDGELDVASYRNGKGWAVYSWAFAPDKYRTIGQSHKRFPLNKHDLTIACSDAGFQKMTFTPESDSLLFKYLNSNDTNLRAVGAKILAEARSVAEGIHNDLARKMTVDEVREKLGLDSAAPTTTGNHASKDLDKMLDGII